MELRSPSETLNCWKCGSETRSDSGPLCSFCSAVLSFPEGLSHFAVMGLAPKLLVDEEALRAKFYELSRKTHPDRFTNAPGQEMRNAVRWSTAINRAHQTLRDPIARTKYLIELHSGAEAGQSLEAAKIPLDLAESYFDLQDLLTEEGGEDRMREFRDELKAQAADTESAWKSLAQAWDSGDKKALDALKNFLVRRRYLSSMIADVDKKLGVSDGDSRH